MEHIIIRPTGVGRAHRGMRRALAILATAGLALVMAGFGMTGLGPTAPAAQAAPYGHCDSVFNTPGLGMDCTVTVVNNLDLATGITSSSTTYTRCSGDANTALTCEGPTTVSSTELVTSISQCNSSLDGGGASMHCSVDVTNNIVGDATAVPATVNQCNDSLGGGGIVLRACSPDPASTSGAAIDQCNNSDNGGGSSLTCIVTPGSTTSAALYVTVSQCNYSANGGGSLIVCATAMRTSITPAAVEAEEEEEEAVLPGSEQRALVQPDELAETGDDPSAAITAALIVSIGVLMLASSAAGRRLLRLSVTRA